MHIHTNSIEHLFLCIHTSRCNHVNDVYIYIYAICYLPMTRIPHGAMVFCQGAKSMTWCTRISKPTNRSWVRESYWCLVGMDGNGGMNLFVIVVMDHSLIPDLFRTRFRSGSGNSYKWWEMGGLVTNGGLMVINGDLPSGKLALANWKITIW